MNENGVSLRLPGASGRRAGLVYIADSQPGISRRRVGREFRYLNSRGRRVRSRRVIARIRALAIPPAWKDVWICPNPRGHLQATGRDARGRKQYVYHAAWQNGRSDVKFQNLLQFGAALPRLRRAVKRQIGRRPLSRETVLVALVLLLDETLLRIGNEEYARTNDSFGLTTLRDRHAKISGRTMRMRFRGKSGIEHDVPLTNRRLARIVRQCQELPGQRLFQYRDEQGVVRPVSSADVNDYLRKLTGQPFTAKEFRTWRATAFVLEQLCASGEEAPALQERKSLVQKAIRAAATALGNTITVCRKYYVHPQIVELFLSGKLRAQVGSASKTGRGLEPAERLLMATLRKLPVPGK